LCTQVHRGIAALEGREQGSMTDGMLPARTGRSARPLLASLVGVNTMMQARDALWGYVFLLPWIIGLIVFFLGPIILSFLLSFTKYDVITPPQFVGLANYETAFTGDDLFWPSLWRTFEYSIVVVPVGLFGSLLLALMLNRGLPGTGFFRTAFFLSTLTPAVALALLWSWILNPDIGPINVALRAIGIPGPGWLADVHWALPSVILINLWGSMGGNTMLIFLAGLQGVPQELYEAAAIDGASGWARFRHVTLPMISPTFFFNLVLGVIGALKVFTTAFVVTGGNGGPNYALWFFALHIYQQAFSFFKMGYASALAWIFVVILLAFTYFQVVLSRRWVYYAGGDE
jgi:multiple sugar transport system permease protein